MPTYQYACTECSHAFEQFQSFSDDALTECPECQGRLRKLFNAVGVVFKGSGFYRTDSRSGSTSEGGTGETGAGSDTKPDTKTDTTSGAKAEPRTASAAGKPAKTPAAAGAGTD